MPNQMRPRSGVNLDALLSRFETTCANRVESASTRKGVLGWLRSGPGGAPRSLAATPRSRGDGAVELQRLAPQDDLAPGDARDVQQIVHQVRQLRDLAGYDVARPLDPIWVELVAAEAFGGVADGRQWIA